jgi:hypothetical protein
VLNSRSGLVGVRFSGWAIVLAITLGLMVPAGRPLPSWAGSAGLKVAVIVGPVGDLTRTYVGLADEAAAAAEANGAVVARAYSPDATPARVLDAAAGANIVIYFGHGTGFPNPYSDTLNPANVNGWGLQGPAARGTHEDSWADGTLAYYGEAWIAAHARPAPGFVMIYSNVCYAPGAGEGAHPPSTPGQARQRAGGYARTPLAMGASAVFANDFYAGAAELVGQLLSGQATPYGDLVRSGRHYAAEDVTVQPHPYAAGAELWLQRSPYFGGKRDYWFAFSGDPTASFASGGVGRTDALLAMAEEPLTLRLQPGEHTALQLDDARHTISEARWTTASVTSLAVSARRQLPGREGAWYQVAEGAYAGFWVAESPSAHPAGLALRTALDPARVVQFAAGTHAGYELDADGSIVASRVASLPSSSSATADAVALLDGQLYVRIADGSWADHWMLVSEAVRLAGPVPLPESATPTTSSATASPSPAPPASAPTAPPAPPTVAPSTPTPSGSPWASRLPPPSPPPSESVIPSPSPAVTPTPSPFALPSETPSLSAQASP